MRGKGVFLGRTGHGRGGWAAWAAGRHQTQTQAARKSDRRPAVCSSESWTVETRQQEERTASQLAKGLDSWPGGQPLPQEASQPGSQPGSTQSRAGDRLREHPPATNATRSRVVVGCAEVKWHAVRQRQRDTVLWTSSGRDALRPRQISPGDWTWGNRDKASRQGQTQWASHTDRIRWTAGRRPPRS